MESVLDYGIRLLRHVLAQVFGNLGQAVLITAAPFLLFGLVAYLLVGPVLLGSEPSAEGVFAAVGVLFPLLLIIFAWVAVAWHRFVLAEEYPSLLPAFSFRRSLAYIGRSILVMLILFAVAIPFALIVFPLAGGAMSSGAGFGLLFIVSIALNLFLSWVLVRVSLILPAGALDEKMTIGESWRATERVAVAVLVPVIAIAVVVAGLQQLVALFPAGPVSIVAQLPIFWVQMLLNLSLLTTLYGTLVEGRELK